MKVGITARLALLLAVVVLFASGATGLYTYRESRSLLVDAAKLKLLTSTQVLARRITINREEMSRNLQVLSRHPAALGALRGSATDEAQMAMLFRLLMGTHPAYVQLRLIGAADFGLERVRVDRHGEALVQVDGAALQEKGHYPYVSETLQLPAGETYLSRITVNHEAGSHAGLDIPVLQLAMPVVPAGGPALGIVVVNVDLEGMFALLAADLPPAFKLYLANGEGDVLIHPDNAKTFGFDKGRRVLVQEEFSPTAALVSGARTEAVFETEGGTETGTRLVAAFIGQSIQIPSSDGRLLLGLAQPLDQVLASSDHLGATIAEMVMGLCLGSLLLAVPVARALTRPINAMNAAAQATATGEPLRGLPVGRRDEIGALARSFAQMQQQIAQQLADLQRKQQELEHLAWHDALTGLPNRRLLADRLALTLAQARRHGTAVALMFIDLDDFKRINDDLGHDSGDSVLRVMAQRLRTLVRETDTVARLGGDEFVVLVDAAPPQAQLELLARKLLDGVRQPLSLGGQSLRLGASIGIARCPEDGQDADTLMSAADHAMYEAKATGEDGFRFAPGGHR